LESGGEPTIPEPAGSIELRGSSGLEVAIPDAADMIGGMQKQKLRALGIDPDALEERK